MNKTVKILIGVAVAVVVILIAIFAFGSKSASSLKISSAEDLTALVDQIYEGVSTEMPMLMTMPVDTTDVDAVKAFTGLDNAENIEYAVVSEPMMNAQAYSMVLVKVKAGANANAIAKEMNENVDERKWICVTAERVYSAASGDVICLVMSNEETAKTVFDSFKTIAGGIEEENVLVRVVEEPELPDDMLLDGPAIDDQPATMPDDNMPIDDQPAAM